MVRSLLLKVQFGEFNETVQQALKAKKNGSLIFLLNMSVLMKLTVAIPLLFQVVSL
jgi:hypothetical protein